MDAKKVLDKFYRDEHGVLKGWNQCLAEMTNYLVQEEKMDPYFAGELTKRVMRDSRLWRLEAIAEFLGIFGLALLFFSVLTLTPRTFGVASSFNLYLSAVSFFVGLGLSVTSKIIKLWWKKKANR